MHTNSWRTSVIALSTAWLITGCDEEGTEQPEGAVDAALVAPPQVDAQAPLIDTSVPLVIDAAPSSDAALVADGGAPDAAAPWQPDITFACPGGKIVAGTNKLTVGGKERDFFVDLPKDTTRELGVIFSWHGFNDSLENHRKKAGLDPDANPELPVIVITPNDTAFQPPEGLDWDIRRGSPKENPDLAFFEAMVGCVHEQFPLDTGRIYSYGFSAGAVMTNLLHSVYPDIVSTTIAASGGFFNDEAEKKLVQFIPVDWQWPELDAQKPGNVLITHGGPNDVAVFWVFDLEKAAQAAFPFLAAHDHVVVDCAHELGHELHPDVTGEVVSRYISSHRAGELSPYRSGGYAKDAFPDSCKLRLPQ